MKAPLQHLQAAFPQEWVSVEHRMSSLSGKIKEYYTASLVIGRDAFRGEASTPEEAVFKCIANHKESDPLAEAREKLEASGYVVTKP